MSVVETKRGMAGREGGEEEESEGEGGADRRGRWN